MDASSRYLAAQVTECSSYRAYEFKSADTDTVCISADTIYQLCVGMPKEVYEMDYRFSCELFRAHNDLRSGTWIIKTAHRCLELKFSGMRESLAEQEVMRKVIKFAAECQCPCMRNQQPQC